MERTTINHALIELWPQRHFIARHNTLTFNIDNLTRAAEANILQHPIIFTGGSGNPMAKRYLDSTNT